MIVFALEYQDLVVTAVQKDSRPLYEDEIELHEAIIIEFNQMEIKKPSTKKRVRIYAEDDTSIAFYKTANCVNNEASK